MKRVSEIDFFRGLAIIWVLFIHSIYWMGFLTSENVIIIKSYLLFEMPLFFLIAGASNSLSNTNISLGKFYFKRITRILIPYWVYSAICVFIMQLSITYLNIPYDISYLSWFVTMGITPLTSNIPYLTWHLWFIPIFIMITLFVPVLIKLHSVFKKNYKFVPLIIMMFLVYLMDKYSLNANYYYYIKHIIFYSFWTYLGLFYYEFMDKKMNKKYLLSTSILFYILVLILIQCGYSPDMQTNKFPPNLVFFFLNVGTISLILAFKNEIYNFFKLLKLDNAINEFGRKSYTVYLYQPFSFLCGGIILSLFNISLIDYDIVGVLFFFIVNLILAKLFMNIFGKIEDFRIGNKCK